MGGSLNYSVPAPDDLAPTYSVPAPDDKPSTIGKFLHGVNEAAAKHAWVGGLPTASLSLAGLLLGRGKQQPTQQTEAHGVLESAKAGWEGSVTSLAVTGRLPDVVLDPHHAKWYERLAAQVAQLAGDMPAMVVGVAAGGAVGGPIGGGAGAFGVPTAIRESLTQAYANGTVTSVGDFLNRVGIVLGATTRDAAIGAATAGVGKLVAGAVSPALRTAVMGAKEGPLTSAASKLVGFGTGVAATGAEIGTMTVAPALLQGRLPEAQEFADAALLIGGLHGAHLAAGRLLTTYAKTGIRPTEVLADAQRDPTIKEDLTRPGAGSEVPAAYQEVAAQVNAQDAVPGVKAKQVVDQPFGPVTQLPGEPAHPTEVNYNYINTSDDVKGALARISQVYEEEIQTQRRGKVSWDETQNEAGQWLKDNLGLDANVETRAPGTPAGAAELLARKQMTQGAAEEVARQAKALQEAGADATQEQRAQFLAAVDRAALITSEFLGARAEAGRTLNILKETKVAAERAEQIQAILSRFDKSPEDIAAMMADMDSAANVLRLARKLSTATTWDKVVEAWKAGLCSGPITQTANLMGNTSFMALRPAVDAVASLFDMRSGADRVRFSEPLARVVGDLQGVADGLRAAKSALIDEAPGGKAEHKQSIPGKAGYWVRSPFRLLSAGDALFRIMVERGEAYALSAREAAKEGFNPATREFRNRVVELAHNPTEAMLDKIDAAGKRFTFNTPLGEKGKAAQKFVKSWHLEMVVPFIATPGNVFKEMARLTPAAPIVGEWRADFKAGGERGAKAMAEVALGTGISALTMTFALSGHISGSGDPDPDRRRVQMASGWQPYSIKIGGTWYSYQRFQPVGTLLGLAADMAEVKKHMTPDEREQVPSIVAAAFAHAVTEQTFLQGMSSVVDVLSDPERSAPKFIQNLAGSAVPALFGQMAQMLDPYQREVQSIREAIQNRIPGLREKLEPQRDMFGEPVQSQQRVAGFTPIGVKTESTDKVRTEAARLGVGVSSAPRSINLPAGGTKAGRVELTPGQRDIFADVAGHTAYQALAPIVNSPAWDYMNDFTKAKVYQDVFAATNKAGKAAALTSEERQAQIHHILQTLADKMKPVE